MNPIVMIPARMASTRLPNKPLALIAGLPMIVQVMRRAKEAGIARVVVACDGEEIAQAVRAHGGEAVLTDPALPSGSDRIHAALAAVDPDQKHDIVINVQGDMPTLDPEVIRQALRMMENPAIDIGTLAALITDPAERTDPAVVKAHIAFDQSGESGKALDFTRTPAAEGAPAYHHIGLYAYRRAALERFVALPPSANEQSRKLEQMRAMDNGMHIHIAVVNTVPLGVDTPETLEKARSTFASASNPSANN
ncbi:MAG: 3-deoxy-manno-octulosonate cytidylyltransferase [Rickettsiales bacterium]|nr:3-deoxy-manno-octulosonate cytidylyltransferase [Rickettsiales bacterium]